MRALRFLLALIVALLAVSGAASAATPNLAGRIVVLDPGHGGKDPGSAECAGLPERDANLDIALRLRDLLELDGAEVYLTRETAMENPTNTQRADFANAHHADVLLSIHLNGSTNHSVDGTIGLWGKRNKDLAFTKAMHAGLAADLSVPDQGVTNFASGVLLKSTMPATIQESVYISNATECAGLTDGTGARQTQIADALHAGLLGWFAGK